MGLIVQFKPEEAKLFIPKLKENLKERMDRLEKEIKQKQILREQFDKNLSGLQMALNPLLRDLESLENM